MKCNYAFIPKPLASEALRVGMIYLNYMVARKADAIQMLLNLFL